MKVINNAGFDKSTAPKLDTQQVFIYQPQTKEDWGYSHHQFITFFKGRFYAMWSSGRTHEDLQGQRVMISSSADGVNWDVPKPLLDSILGEHIDVTLTASGFYVFDGKLNAYIGQYEYDIEGLIPVGHAQVLADNASQYSLDMFSFPGTTHRNTKMLIMTSEDGVNFTQPIDTHLPIVPNFPPQPLQSGRLLISGNIMYPYSDDKTGISGWKKAGIYAKSEEETVYDDSEGLEIIKKKQGWASHRCEGAFYQLPDGTINMLLRSGTPILYCSQSKDNGVTWSEPFATEFSDDTTKFYFGKLPDGRFYYIGNPVSQSGRCPLVLSISSNGIDFDKHYIIENKIFPKRFEGLCKGGMYGYPHSLVHGNKLYVIYSVNKESVAVSSFDISKL